MTLNNNRYRSELNHHLKTGGQFDAENGAQFNAENGGQFGAKRGGQLQRNFQIGHALQTDTYFTRPYTSQDKGTVENRIGVIRRFYPKKTDLTLLTDKDVMDVERKINNRPIRKFNYLNANLVPRNKIALIT